MNAVRAYLHQPISNDPGVEDVVVSRENLLLQILSKSFKFLQYLLEEFDDWIIH